MVFEQGITDFTFESQSECGAHLGGGHLGTFPRTRDKTLNNSQQILPLGGSSIKATSSINLSTNPDEVIPCNTLDLHQPRQQENNGVHSDTIDDLGLTTFDTFGVSENVLNQILPTLEQTWKEVLLENKPDRLEDIHAFKFAYNWFLHF